ncbi:hypothetical protein DXG03_005039 [Asterophora parasitica]|uniref:WD40 repeat-like protein n=1 Tax=Asterophora parasitica TaxID=117018 RepID=A0A9P7GEV3_9AGAR|nr:hypothetical protein DXG03_005039 [Asterophora parasitica]
MASNSSNFLIAEAQLVLDEARRQKSERIKTLGSPIQLSGKALSIQVRGNYAWVAENTAVARKLDLESGKTTQLYKGHMGPVTTLAFCDKVPRSGDERILITGAWDQTKELLSSTPKAHGDFVKSLFVLPSINLLVSSGSDKMVRFWDLSTPQQKESLRSMGSISSHTRPVECLDGKVLSDTSAILYTADTMGVIKSWILTTEGGPSPRWRGSLQEELGHHRTRINEMLYGNGHLWTDHPPKRPTPPIAHPVAVRSILPLALTELAEPYLITGAGDYLRVYDLSTPEEPELLRDLDAHWHDITAIRLWKRSSLGLDGQTRIEPWVISTSLDGTIRRWRLSELLVPAPLTGSTPPATVSVPDDHTDGFQMTEDEERELAELLD